MGDTSKTSEQLLRVCKTCKSQCIDPDYFPDVLDTDDLRQWLVHELAIPDGKDWYCEPCYTDRKHNRDPEGGGSIRA